MKTLSVSEAQALGFKTFQAGLKRFLPVKLPREVATQDAIRDALLEQFEGAKEDGTYTLVIQTELPGLEYVIIVGTYSEDEGCGNNFDAYGAVEVRA